MFLGFPDKLFLKRDHSVQIKSSSKNKIFRYSEFYAVPKSFLQKYVVFIIF